MIPVLARWTSLIPVALLTLSHSCVVHAETRVWLIGGGNTLENSQGQIEENVRWLQSVFRQQGISVNTFYTDGGSEEHDVVYFAHAEDRDPTREPLLRVYGSGLSYAQRTRRNSLTNVDGSTEKSELSSALIDDFKALNDDDSVLLVYNGHGGINTNDTRKNNLMLWGDTRLTISELDDVLDHAPSSVPVRFVLTQCFSGSFSSLIYENPYSDTLADQPRCGFLAESDRREAEGCDLGTNQAEFRDYTTYFFAALDQKTRLGEQIPLTEVDLDHSGDVSFHEAHVYTLTNAYSSDLSRSTSETFIERWEPWYLRWNSFIGTDANNNYSGAAATVRSEHELPKSGLGLLIKRRDLARAERETVRELREVRRAVSERQEQIRALVEQPIDSEHLDTLPHTALEAQAEQIRSLEEYRDLVRLQSEVETLNTQRLQIGRDYTQAEKLLRLSRLARLIDQFRRHASPQSKADFGRLTSCEGGTLK